jgi:hypothetical protein
LIINRQIAEARTVCRLLSLAQGWGERAVTVPGCGPLLALRAPLKCIGLLASHLYLSASGKYAKWRIFE